jgi:hypothetical protein
MEEMILSKKAFLQWNWRLLISRVWRAISFLIPISIKSFTPQSRNSYSASKRISNASWKA